MIVYFNCYVWGEGYSMKYMEYPNGTLDEFSIRSGKMPDWERKVLTSTGSYMFYGNISGQQFGCVRMIESGKFDENGRGCYYNIAFSEGANGEGLVPLIMGYAKEHYQDFCKDVLDFLYYKGADYLVRQDAFMSMCEHAKRAAVCLNYTNGSGFLWPESSEDYFFANTQIPVNKEKIQVIKELKTEKKVQQILSSGKNESMHLFFYCSTPSMGYVMKQIDADTGKVLCEGKEAGERMPEHAFALTTRSGASAALYRTTWGQCLVIKNIRSVKTDQYGRHKHMTIAFEAGREKNLMLTQFAAWAMLDFKNFSAAVTDCVSVYDGPKGFVVDVEKLKALFVPFEKRIRKVRTKYQKIWYRLVNADDAKRFQCLALEASLDYFVRSTEVQATRDQIAIMINDEKIGQWKEDPLSLEFTSEMYQEHNPGVVTADGSQTQKTEKVAADKVQEAEPAHESGTETEMKSEQELSEDTKEEVLELEEMDAPAADDTDPRGVKDKDYIDLMDKKWFKAVLIIGGALVVGAAVFLIKKFL